MKLKLDENLSRHLKPVLTGLGHDVLTAADENLLSRPDTEVAAVSIQIGAEDHGRQPVGESVRVLLDGALW